MGLGDFLSGVKDAAVNVGKGLDYAIDPGHWDDIAEGAGKAASFVAENPGQTWDTAFEVGRSMAKDQLDPMNLAINAGLIGLTVATGGAAAPALAAKLGMGAKSLQAGVTAAKATDTAVDVVKGVKTGAKAIDTAVDVAKGIDTAADVGRNVSRTQEFATGIKQIGTGIRESKGLERVENVLNAPREFAGTAREAAGMSRYGKVAELRAGQANKVLGNAEEAGGVRKYAARKIGGSNNALVDPGASTAMSRTTSAVGRAKAATEAPTTPTEVARGVEVAADPQKAIEEAAAAKINEMTGEGTGYVDRGMTTENVLEPAGGGGEPPAFTPMSTAPAGSEPAGSFSKPTKPQKVKKPGDEPVAPTKPAPWKPKQHLWEGPGREAFGGISATHDWRTIQPLRKIEAPSVGTVQAHRQYGEQMEQYKTKKAGWDTQTAARSAYEGERAAYRTDKKAWKAQQGAPQAGGDLNEQGAPANFAPEMTKSGSYMTNQGVDTGSSLATMEPRSHNLGNVRDIRQPIGAIDVTSSSPDDYGTEPGGQGTFAFPELGAQPNAYPSPAFRAQSRTSGRRAIGPGTLGV